MALRALHVSNDTRLFLGQHASPSKSAETTELRPFLEQLIADYAKTALLEVISIDAGMLSQENAAYVVERGLDYIMALNRLHACFARWLPTLAGELCQARCPAGPA
jgi:hypothetical protein